MPSRVRPSLLLKMRIDERQYSEDVALEIKRSYSHVAPSSVSSCFVAEADDVETPLENAIRLAIRMSAPYWHADDAEEQEQWDVIMPKWLGNMFRKVSNAMAASNNVRKGAGQRNLDYTWAEAEFDDNALIAFKTVSDSSIPDDALQSVEHVRSLMAAEAFGSGEVACVRIPSKASYEEQVAAAAAAKAEEEAAQAEDDDAAEAEPEDGVETAGADEATDTETDVEEASPGEEAEEEEVKEAPSMPQIDVDDTIWGIEYADGSIRAFDSGKEVFVD
ncbi:MAG: hypothetical protein LUD25_05060 [Coriobacteriaceae bacterium]|nr:hypothetical protein [Coriobacteriaceae bacterium]